MILKERASEADATGDLGEPVFGFRTVNQVERRQCGE
jgi:hypothetical protein